MALEHTKLDIVHESPKKVQKIDSATLDFVFGKSDDTTKPEKIEMNNSKHVSSLLSMYLLQLGLLSY